MDFYVVLVLETVLQYVELEHAHNTDDNFFHTGVVFLEDLDCTFLCNLVDALHELLTLHGVNLANTGEMLRCESRNTFESELVLSGS